MIRSLALIAALACATLAYAANSGPVDPKHVEAVEGDTIDVGPDVVRFRLVGFDTPASGSGAKCTAERERGNEAKRKLQQLVAGGDLNLQRVDCACARGTEGTAACNQGRFCGVLKAGGKDVADIMIEAGLAEKYICGRDTCPAPKNWCPAAAPKDP